MLIASDATEVVHSKTARHALSTTALARLQQFYLNEPYWWLVDICNNPELTFDEHRPVAYLMAGRADLLAPLLSDYEHPGYFIHAIRAECRRHKVDWATQEGIRQLRDLLRFQNDRFFRGCGKSTIAHGIDLLQGTINPNTTCALFSVSDDRAYSFTRQIRSIIQSDVYRDIFGYRVPDGKFDLSENKIILAGRSINSPQASFEAYGYQSKSVIGGHWDRFSVDDLQTEANSSDAENIHVVRFLSGLVSLYMPGEVWRLHIGTRYRDDDDHATLLATPNCFNLVIPIEIHDGYVEDISVRGTPTLPDARWFPTEKIEAHFKITLASPDGASQWRSNQLLDPSAGDALMFPARLVDEALFEFLDAQDKVTGKKKKYVMRPMYGKDGMRKKNADGDALYKRIDLATLDRVFGCDLATSMASDADEWAICVLGRDSDDCEYELAVEAAKGWENFENMLEYLYDIWNPRRIGMEKAGAQEALVNLMKAKNRFMKLRSKIEMVGHGYKAKDFRILNNVAEHMKMKKLFGNAADVRTQAEKKKYRPGRHAVDNRLDAISIATTVSRSGTKDVDEISKLIELRNARMRRL